MGGAEVESPGLLRNFALTRARGCRARVVNWDSDPWRSDVAWYKWDVGRPCGKGIGEHDHDRFQTRSAECSGGLLSEKSEINDLDWGDWLWTWTISLKRSLGAKWASQSKAQRLWTAGRIKYEREASVLSLMMNRELLICCIWDARGIQMDEGMG